MIQSGVLILEQNQNVGSLLFCTPQAYPGQTQLNNLGTADKQNLAFFCWTNFFWQWNDCMNVRSDL